MAGHARIHRIDEHLHRHSGHPECTRAYAAAEFAKNRTVAYTDLIMSDSPATRTVRRLNLDIAPRDLAKKIHASAKPDSVVITLSVTDSSPSRAGWFQAYRPPARSDSNEDSKPGGAVL
jgi:hypothetical protein